MSKPIVCILAFDGISPFHLSVPCLIFGEDRTSLGLPRFDIRVCAPERGPVKTEAGLEMVVPYGLEAMNGADILIVPSWKNLNDPVSGAIVEALCRAHRDGALLVGLCLGSFAIAATGLLDGRRAATHWDYADRLQA